MWLYQNMSNIKIPGSDSENKNICDICYADDIKRQVSDIGAL